MSDKYKCWRCGHELGDIPRSLPRLEQCPACEADLHVCRLCCNYKPSLSSKCDHDLAEPAREVDVANFCQYLRINSQAYVAKTADKEQQAKDKLAALFGDESAEKATESSDDPTDKLKSLFDELPRDE